MANNKDLRVVPLGGRHRSFNSLAGEAMEDKRAKRGIIFWFDDEGIMHVGEFGVEYADVGMAMMHLTQIAATWDK